MRPGPRRPSRRRPVLGLLPAIALLAGCGLPLSEGVRSPGQVPVEQRLPEPINVLPPGPQPGASAEDVVLGFLAAQSSARDDHGVARSFLAPAARAAWDDDAGATVYDPSSVRVSEPRSDGDGVVVALGVDVVGQVGADGAARVEPPRRSVQPYRLRREAGEWRLVDVPPGLTLSPAGRGRAYRARTVHFLAPPAPGVGRHLVADLVHLPDAADPAAALVDRLLAGPSSSLVGSVETAVPPGTRLVSPVGTNGQGEVTVDLSAEVLGLSDAARQDLSAQLVWTLRQVRDFSRLRLLVQGGVLDVPGVAQPQPRNAWSGHAPDGLVDRPAAAGLVDGRLRAPEAPDLPPAPGPVDAPSRIVDFALDPRAPRLAVLTASDSGRTLWTGPRGGPLSAGPAGGFRSPTWGSGQQGVYLLRTAPRPAVLLKRPDDGPLLELAVPDLPALGADSVLRVSRDGVRLALVADGVLYVGRVVVSDAGPRVEGLHRLTGWVRDVAWRTGTSLAVLVEDESPPLLPLVTLSVDGTSSSSSGLLGVAEGEPVALAAYGERPLLVETRLQRRSTTYSGRTGRGFEVWLRDASRPGYPR